MGQTTVFPEEARVTRGVRDDDVRVAEIAGSMAAALNQESAVVCVATGTHRRLIEQQLKARGIDVVGALMREQLVCLNAFDTLTKIMVDGQLDVIRFAEVIGASVDRAATRFQHVLIFGELDLLLRLTGHMYGAQQFHHLWVSFIDCRPMFRRCPDLEGRRQQPNRVLAIEGALALAAPKPN
jgi:hypothetical protein